MKKLIGDPRLVVEDLIDGLVRTNERLRRIADQPVIVRADTLALTAAGRVALISGGGSGHEPAHAGYVGQGMLTAAVLGEVFTSPSVDAILAAIRFVTGPAGSLLIVKNYTGDRLNFGLAAAIARAEGLEVEMVLVEDDAALAGGGRIGRRGLAGTVLVHKLAGAAAEAGQTLSDVKRTAEQAIARIRTMGVGLTACTVPIAGKPNFSLGEDELEFGLGIHGEPGMARGTLQPADHVVAQMLDKILVEAKCDPVDDPIVLLVNGLGGTPAMELAIVAGFATSLLRERGYTVARVGTGNFLTALEMAGCSLSVMPATNQELSLLDAATTAPAWLAPTAPGQEVSVELPAQELDGPIANGPSLSPEGAVIVRSVVDCVIDCLCQSEDALTELDRQVGDGDLGISLARGARAVEAELADKRIDAPAQMLDRVSRAVRRSIGGTSGPLSAALFLGMSAHLAKLPSAATPSDWAKAFSKGVEAVATIGGAGRGDRTMMDALLPAADLLIKKIEQGASPASAMAAAAQAALTGAEGTRDIIASLGRSTYIGERALGYPDPGAWAVALVLHAVAENLEKDGQ
jgi:dihydroxyacetone kinase